MSKCTCGNPSPVYAGFDHDTLHNAYVDYVKPVKFGESWKSRVSATVDECEWRKVSAAMNYMGSIVDDIIFNDDGTVTLHSAGYWAHGF